jgi:hypothetical protein
MPIGHNGGEENKFQHHARVGLLFWKPIERDTFVGYHGDYFPSASRSVSCITLKFQYPHDDVRDDWPVRG